MFMHVHSGFLNIFFIEHLLYGKKYLKTKNYGISETAACLMKDEGLIVIYEWVGECD